MQVLSYFANINLQHLVTSTTHRSCNRLDVVLADNPDNCDILVKHCNFSDHFLVSFQLSISMIVCVSTLSIPSITNFSTFRFSLLSRAKHIHIFTYTFSYIHIFTAFYIFNYCGSSKPNKHPGLTKTSYHTISIYEKLLVIQFHTYRKLYENSMISIFPYMKIV